MPVSASKLRADVYRLLDQVIETGEPLEIERRGVILRIVGPPRASWIDRLPRRDGVVVGDPESLVHHDWSSEWSPELP
jgi:hypothetical protein